MCRASFRDDQDRADFVARLATRVAATGLAYLWVEVLGQPGRPLAPLLGVQPAGVLKAARRGAREAARWHQVLATCR